LRDRAAHTVRHWRVADRRPHAATGCATCGHPAHDFARVPTAPYAYLLGIYLGDGHITSGARDVKRLQVYCDAKYTEIAATIADAIGAVIGRPGSIRRHARARMLYVSSYSKQWPCLLPQHGVGRKHERPIVLAPWQQAHVEAHPDQLIRGLIHSDGTRCLNKVRAQGRSYAYRGTCSATRPTTSGASSARRATAWASHGGR